MPFVESVGAYNNDIGAHPQTLLTEIKLRVQRRLQLSEDSLTPLNPKRRFTLICEMSAF